VPGSAFIAAAQPPDLTGSDSRDNNNIATREKGYL